MKALISLLVSIFFLISCKEDKISITKTSIIGKEYNSFSKSKKVKYLDSIQTNLMAMKSNSTQIKLLFELAAEYYYLNYNKSSYKVSKKIYSISESINDSLSMGRAYYYMGDCHEVFQKDSAYYYYKESEKIFRKINDDEKIAKALFNKAHLLFTEGNFIESEVETIKALQKIKNSNNYETLYSCYYLLGSNHTELEEYTNAIHYFNLAQENLSKDNKIDENKFFEYNTLVVIAQCNIYDKTKKFNKSISQLKKIATKKLKEKQPILYSTVIGNIAYSLMKNGKFKEAKTYYETAFELSKNDNTQSYLYKIINLGEYYLLTKDSVKANALFNEALLLSKQLKSGQEELKTLKFLALIDTKKAAIYKNQYVLINDSIIKKQRSSRNKFARIEFETDQVEAKNKVLNYRNIALGLGISISVIVFLLIIYSRHKISLKKEVELLEQRNFANEELFKLMNNFQIELVQTKQNEQNRISKELHDGIMNQIYGVRLNLGFLNEFDDADSKEKRLVLVKELQKIETEIRSLSHDLSSENNFNNSDYNFLLENLISSKNKLSATKYRKDINELIDWNIYSAVIKINIYRIIQELFLNVNKYANASTCLLKIDVNNSNLLVSVIDDGIGFDTTKISDGIGLKNIKERLEQINGTMSVLSSKNNGSQFYIKIQIDS